MSAGDAPRLAMVAGEASGDLLAGLLLGGLKQRWPALRSFGIGGPRMQAQGFEAWWPHDLLSVMGYAEAVPKLRQLLAVRRQLGDRLLADPPDALIGVDAPDFNFGLEARMKAAGVKAIHFVSPSIWAWRAERVHKIGRSVDHVLCLFPFEPELYQRHGIGATYVGHPLADAIPLEVPRAASRSLLDIVNDATVVALLPGSRRSEIRYIAPRLIEAAVEMRRRRPELVFVMPVVPGLRTLVEPLIAAHAGQVNIRLLDGRSHEALAACDVTLVASGTATLEAALFKRPMVIAYHMHWLNWQLMKRRKLLPWVGLPNVLLREFAVPELLQEAATPKALADAALQWLDDPARTAALQAKFETLHHQLRRDTARSATDAIEEIIAG